jgi:hypothetical protein
MLNQLFSKNKQNQKDVHCEFTGDKTVLHNTYPLVKIESVIAIKNLSNPKINKDQKTIIPEDKPPLEYYCEIIVPEDLRPIFGRLFATVSDPDDPEISTCILSEEGKKKFSGTSVFPFAQYINDGVELLRIPDSMFVSIIDTNIELNDLRCDQWDVLYKGISGKYRYKKIIEQNDAPLIPGVLMPGYNMAVSGRCEKNPNGKDYMFKTEDKFNRINLASNESAVTFSIKNNAIIYYNDFLNKGKLRALTPQTVELNRNLGNAYKYRSLYF